MSAARARAGRRAWSGSLGRLADYSTEDPPLTLIVGTAATAAVLVVLHVIQAAGLATGSAALAALPVGVAITVPAGCLAVLLWLLRQTRLIPGQPGYALAVVFSVATLCVGAEALAGLTTLLWQHGVIRPTMPGRPSLWRSEGHYLWNVLGSVPLLAAPQTLGWRDPQPFADHASGALLLAFKVAIIAPLIRLGLSGYQFLEDRRAHAIAERHRKARARLASAQQPGKLRSYRGPTRQPSPGEVWGFLAVRAVALIAAAAAVAVLFNAGYLVNRRLVGLLRPGISIGSAHLSLAWLPTAVQWLILVALIVAIRHAVRYLPYSPAGPDYARTMAVAAGSILVYVWLLALLTLTFAAASLALLHIGVAAARPGIPPGGQLRAAVDWYAWVMADSLPGPNIPATLNWPLPYRFTDHWSSALLLLYKIAFLSVLLFPVYRAVRVYAAHARRPGKVKPSLPAAGQFADLLLAARATLDQNARNIATEPSTIFRGTWGALAELESSLDDVRALFGDGDGTSRAYAAWAAASDWDDAIVAASFEPMVRSPVSGWNTVVPGRPTWTISG